MSAPPRPAALPAPAAQAPRKPWPARAARPARLPLRRCRLQHRRPPWRERSARGSTAPSCLHVWLSMHCRALSTAWRQRTAGRAVCRAGGTRAAGCSGAAPCALLCRAVPDCSHMTAVQTRLISARPRLVQDSGQVRRAPAAGAPPGERAVQRGARKRARQHGRPVQQEGLQVGPARAARHVARAQQVAQHSLPIRPGRLRRQHLRRERASAPPPPHERPLPTRHTPIVCSFPRP